MSRTSRFVFASVAVAMVAVAFVANAAGPLSPWPAVALPAAREVKLSGPLGESLDRGVARLAKPPYSEAWLRADVSFELQRIFTNYSGDVSGRFLELASLTSPPGRREPATLAPLMKTIAKYQKPDGHFGVDIDLSKPLPPNAPPIPMLWGNARLLVGLLTAAREFHDPSLLAAAKRLGDFYVNSAERLCSPAREADYRGSGSGGDGYTCCYFPAIEGLAMLYVETKDDRYLKQARRMAEFFARFDKLPIDHSHGNLCAWRGILMLYEITGAQRYLDTARAKWDAAMQGGYVWLLGGVGEHWYVSFGGDEGCSESDWLRFNLDLWRFTGETRYLDVAERLLANQYATNQCPNGGFGMCKLDAEPAGPLGVTGHLQEWPFCCSFHGPLGLHFLKSYLAAGSEQGIFLNLFGDYSTRVKAAGREWGVAVKTRHDFERGEMKVTARIDGPRDGAAAGTTLWVRMPAWAKELDAGGLGSSKTIRPVRGIFPISVRGGSETAITLRMELAAEDRRFRKQQASPERISRLRDVAVVLGPDLLFAAPATGGRPTLLAIADSDGRIDFPAKAEGGYATVTLPALDVAEKDIPRAALVGKAVALRPWPAMNAYSHGTAGTDSAVTLADLGRAPHARHRRATFMADLVVVPRRLLAAELPELAKRLAEAKAMLAPAPRFGDGLEKHPDYWLSNGGWKFAPGGLLVSGGEIGLLDGEGYGDYRLEFDVTLPKEGQGMAGWIVRAQDEDNCLMFQLQSADSTYNDAKYKTRPNTLRPHVRADGQWEIADPVPLPKPVRRGEPHHVAVECRGGTVEVFLDGQRIYEKKDVRLRGGTVGFRAAGPGEQGLYQHIGLLKLK